MRWAVVHLRLFRHTGGEVHYLSSYCELFIKYLFVTAGVIATYNDLDLDLDSTRGAEPIVILEENLR